MSGRVFAPLLRSTQGAGIGSATRAAACLANDTYPRTLPLSPSHHPAHARRLIHDLTGRLRRDYNCCCPLPAR
jgi:hypothetical protein